MKEYIKLVGNQKHGVLMVDLPSRESANDSYTIDLQNNAHVPWGEKDNFPSWANELLGNDPHAIPSLNKKVLFLLGLGIYHYNNATSQRLQLPKIEDWLNKFDHDLGHILKAAATNLEYYGNYFIEVILGNFNDKIVDFYVLDCHYVRALPMKKGQAKPNKYIIRHSYSTDNATYELPVFDWENPRKHNHFILHIKCPIPGNPYYGVPGWYGAKSELDLKRKILEAQILGVETGWNIKYQMEIHETFYADCNNDELAKKRKKQGLVNDLNRMLRGKVNNAIVTELVTDHRGKPYSGVKINKIGGPLLDAGITKLVKLKQNAMPASFGIDPILVGIDTNNNFGSGAEIKDKFILHQSLNVPKQRQKLLKFFDMVQLVEGWSKFISFDFQDIDIKKLDIK